MSAADLVFEPLFARRSARFDIAAQAALGRYILDVAQCQPHLPWRYPGAECLVRGPAADTGEDQAAAKNPGVACSEFIVHEPPKVTDPHP
ncbi:hypothetical protein QFZ79_004267 [Arthrobacter sp. V4I6]|nr:hypothetical protein [Arthrobacter sp. V1I7]MDQ0856156.1 hypothetical protein [Arthrobacter sp. V4I6]